MMQQDWLTARFESNRSRLSAVAYRMLGSHTDAEDAVQEAWLRLGRSDAAGVENLDGWLTTVVSRVCLDMLRSRRSRGEASADSPAPLESVPAPGLSPEQETLLGDSVGLALLAVLDRLGPAERVAFVLHDMFDLSFDEIAPIVGRSPAAARQLASRARRRVRGTGGPSAVDDGPVASELPGTGGRDRRRELVAAFLAASRAGDFDGLLALLDPDVVLRADAAALLMGATSASGADAVARTFVGRARGARLALVGGTPGLVWAAGGQTRVAFEFTIAGGKVVGIDLVADPVRLTELKPVVLGA